jgi:hypothetical protein
MTSAGAPPHRALHPAIFRPPRDGRSYDLVLDDVKLDTNTIAP